MSRISALGVPPPCSVSSRTARSSATSATAGSTPRSQRFAASLNSLCRRAVRPTIAGSQCAASKSTVVVPATTSLVSPPITAASEIGPVSSQMTMSSLVSTRLTPSRVVSFSPASARRTTSCPAIRSASKACIG